MAYHISDIKKGEYGTSSKIQEEIEELMDAEKQKAKIMAIIELSDIIGSVQGYLEKNYPYLTIFDLIKMSDITRSAFMDGTRK